MHHQNIKNLLIFGLTLLSFGFLSAQFVIPNGISNAYQLIQRVWITTSGTTTGTTVVDFNTGSNKIYVNPNFLSPTSAYSGQYLLTLDSNGYLSFASGTNNIISNVIISGGNLLIGLGDGSTFNAGPAVGPQGPQGIQGIQGPIGATGAVGATGATGPQGIQGDVGPQGNPGQDGIDGQNGVDGADGLSAYEIAVTAGFVGDESAWLASLVGPQGEQGDTGPQGEQGIQGEQGPQGEPGQDGVGIAQNLSVSGNDLTISDGNTIDLGSLGFRSLIGNTITDPVAHFLGTTNNQDLAFRANNIEYMRILAANGYVGIGTDTPDEQLTVDGSFSSINNDFILSNTDTTFDGDPGVGMQGATGDQQYWIGINDDGNGFFTNEMSYTNTTTNTYANYGINPNFGVVMNRWDNIGTFPGGKSAIGVGSGGVRVIGKDSSMNTNMIRYDNNFLPLMHLQNNGMLGINVLNPDEMLEIDGSFLSTTSQPSGTFGLANNDDVFGGNPGAGAFANEGNEFVYAGVDFDGNKLSAELVFTDGNASQFISTSPNGPAMILYGGSNSYYNSINITGGGIISTIKNPLQGSANFFRTLDNNTEIMRLTNTGTLGIGTTSPGNTVDIGGSYVGGNTLGLRFSDRGGNSGEVLGLNDDGDVVLLGEVTGPQGPQGIQGNDGVDGLSAYEIAVVEGGFTGDESAWLASLVGPQGPQGEQGIQGPQGEQGIQGITGAMGTTGATGPQGIQGDVGPQGPQGEIGPQGPQGEPGQDGSNGIDGNDGISIQRLGSFASAPGSPALNQAYYNTTDGIAYIRDGDSREIIAQDGTDGIGGYQSLSLSGNNLSIDDGNTIDLGSLGFWSLIGNAIIDPVTHFLGTTNNQDLAFRANNIEYMRILAANGYVGIGTDTPDHQLTVDGGIYTNDGAQGFQANDNMYLNGAPIGIPGAMASAYSGGEIGFLFAGKPNSNPLFDAGVGAFLGYVNTDSVDNDRAIISVKSGNISLDIDQNDIDVVSIDIDPAYFEIKSSDGITWWDNFFIDLLTNKIGVNMNNPTATFHVNGSIASSIITVTSADAFYSDGNEYFLSVDVAGVNTIEVNPAPNQIFYIVGMRNASPGQKIDIITTSVDKLMGGPAGNVSNPIFLFPHEVDFDAFVSSMASIPGGTQRIYAFNMNENGLVGPIINMCSGYAYGYGCVLGASVVSNGTYMVPSQGY